MLTAPTSFEISGKPPAVLDVSSAMASPLGIPVRNPVESPMRILWVKVGGLWPVNSGGRLRSFNIIRELSRRHRVSVITTHGLDESQQSLLEHLPGCTRVTSLPFAAPKRNSPRFVLALVKSWFSPLPVDLHKYRIEELRTAVSREMASGSYDICVADFLSAMPNLPNESPLPVVFFAHNVEHMIWKRLCSNDSNWLRRALLEVEWRKMRRYETRACQLAQLTVAVSEDDRDRLLDESPLANGNAERISAIPTGVDIEYFQPANSTGALANPVPMPLLPAEKELVFTGSMDWHPNEDGMLWFMQAILPTIRETFPALSVTIVGRNPSALLRQVASECRVLVTGTVADIRPWVERATVFIVPLRIGGGTRLKIFEALAMGKAVVSTTIGAEGLPLQEGKHILRSDNPLCFAARVVELLQDKPRRERMGAAGRLLMEEKFSWHQVADNFAARCASAIHSPPSNPEQSIKGYEL